MKKIILTALAFVAVATSASAATNEELAAQFAAGTITLPQFIAGIQANATMPATTTGTTTKTYVYSRLLKVGKRGNDVAALQTCLNRLGNNTGVADGIFGRNTAAGVRSFQAAHGLVVDGIIGRQTGPQFEEACTITTEPTTPEPTTPVEEGVTGDKLAVSGIASDDQFVGNNQTVVFAKLTLEAGDEDVKVRKIKVEFDGSASSDSISKVVLLDSAMIQIDDDSLDSSDEASLRADFTVKDGDKKVVYVAAKTAAAFAHDGLEGTLKVTAITTSRSAVEVEGLPIAGANHTFNSGVSADKFQAELTVEEAGSVKIGEEGVKVATINVENKSDSDNKEIVKSLKLKRVGTARDDSIDNVEIKVNGRTVSASQDDDEYTFDFGENGVELDESGDDVDFVAYADVEDDAAKTFAFYLSDIVVVDEAGTILSEKTTTDAAKEAGETSAGGAANNIYDTYEDTGVATIDLSDISISKTSDVQSGKVSAAQEGAELASFKTEVTGKDVTGDLEVTVVVSNVEVEDADGAASTDADKVDTKDVDLDNLAIYTKSGDRVSDKEDTSFAITPADGTADQMTYTVTFDDVTFNEGSDPVDYVIKGDINKDAPDGAKYEITKIKYVNIEDEDGEEITDYTETISSPAKIEVEAALVELEMENASDTDLNADTDNVEVAQISVDASNSGDDIELTQVKVHFAIETKEVSKLTVTHKADAAGNVTVTLNGTGHDVAMAGDASDDTTDEVAEKIKAAIDALADYSATRAGSVVTITAANARSETDIAFAADAGVNVTATTEVAVQGSDADLNDLRNCQIFDGSKDISNKETAASTVTFDIDDLVVAKGTTKTLSVKCDVGSDFANGNKVTVSGASFDARGVNTSKKLDDNFGSNGTATVTTGSTRFRLAPGEDANKDKIVKDDANDVILGVYEFKAKDSELTLNTLKVTFDSNVSAKFDGAVVVDIDGTEESDTATNANPSVVEITGIGKEVAKDSTITITVKADMKSGASGDFNIDKVEATTEEGVVVADVTDDGPTVTVTDAIPVVTQVSETQRDGVDDADDMVLFAYKVKADGDDIALKTTRIKLEKTDATLSNVTAYLYDNASRTGSEEVKVELTAGQQAGTDDIPFNTAISKDYTYYVFVIADVTSNGGTVRATLVDDANSAKFATADSDGDGDVDGDDAANLGVDKLIDNDMKSRIDFKSRD